MRTSSTAASTVLAEPPSAASITIRTVWPAQGVSAIVNPDKLQHLGPVADLRALLRERS